MINIRVSPGFPISAISHPLIRPSQQGVLSRRAGVFKRAERGGGGCHADRKRVSVGVVFIQFHSDNSAAQFATYFTVSPLCRDLWPRSAVWGSTALIQGPGAPWSRGCRRSRLEYSMWWPYTALSKPLSLVVSVWRSLNESRIAVQESLLLTKSLRVWHSHLWQQRPMIMFE